MKPALDGAVSIAARRVLLLIDTECILTTGIFFTSDGPILTPKGLSFGCFYEVKELIPLEGLQFTIPKFMESTHH